MYTRGRSRPVGPHASHPFECHSYRFLGGYDSVYCGNGDINECTSTDIDVTDRLGCAVDGTGCSSVAPAVIPNGAQRRMCRIDTSLRLSDPPFTVTSRTVPMSRT
jgi:hypothetical protein